MAYITNEQIEAASDNRKSGVLARIAAGFVSATNHCFEKAKNRLPVIHESELGGKESIREEQRADGTCDTEWDTGRKDRSESRGYLSPEHYHFMYY